MTRSNIGEVTTPGAVIPDEAVEAAQTAARSCYPGIDSHGGWMGPIITNSAMRAALTDALPYLAAAPPSPAPPDLEEFSEWCDEIHVGDIESRYMFYQRTGSALWQMDRITMAEAVAQFRASRAEGDR